MLEQYFRLMRWWPRKWYPVFRFVSWITGQPGGGLRQNYTDYFTLTCSSGLTLIRVAQSNGDPRVSGG